MGETFRVDAKAESDVVVLGGWSLAEGLDTQKAGWFSFRLSRDEAPWVFEIASLELLATLVGVILFTTPVEGSRYARPRVVRLTSGTDNQGD